jgi:hypothetical protein
MEGKAPLQGREVGQPALAAGCPYGAAALNVQGGVTPLSEGAGVLKIC